MNHGIDNPSEWIARFAALANRQGRALDLAAGTGRHTRFLLDAGFRVTAVDSDVSGLDGLDADIVRSDLESAGGWRPKAAAFDLIVVANYLHRPLLPILCDALAPGGVLIYETFARGNDRFGRPRNPDFLLRPNELLEAFAGRLTIVAFEQGRIDLPRPAVIQRLCATRDRDLADIALPPG